MRNDVSGEFDLEEPIIFDAKVASHLGSVTAALFVSYSRSVKKRGGWFHKTAEEIERETGLSRRQQETVRKILRGMGFLSEELVGMPPHLFFEIDELRLNREMSELEALPF